MKTKKKKSPQRKRTESKARQLKKAEDVLRQLCFNRDGKRCVRCGRTTSLCMSHVYPKGRYPRMRLFLDNVKTLCFGCHIPWWHKHPIEAAEWFKEKYPERAIILKALSQQHLPELNYAQITEDYKELLLSPSKN